LLKRESLEFGGSLVVKEDWWEEENEKMADV
jgi:hypothetical protein